MKISILFTGLTATFGGHINYFCVHDLIAGFVQVNKVRRRP